MFSSLGLFKGVPCPEMDKCERGHHCAFSHDRARRIKNTVHIPVDAPKPAATSASVTGSNTTHIAPPASSSKSKRAPIGSPNRSLTSSAWSTSSAPTSASKLPGQPPPAKLARVGKTATQSRSIATVAESSTGVPTLRATNANSRVPIVVRQAMLANLYEHFSVLYQNISASAPTMAAEHALKQEQRIHDDSTKFTYRNAVVNSLVALKKRELPTTTSHPSVGTASDLAERASQANTLSSLVLTRTHLAPLVLTLEEQERWAYVTVAPPGPGGMAPSEKGQSRACERCGARFEVKAMEDAEECRFHYGRMRRVAVNDGKERIYTCCHQPYGSEGCTTGVHVFYESNPELLHARHAFTPTKQPTPSFDADSDCIMTSPIVSEFTTAPHGKDKGKSRGTALDVCCLDCEMVYTTAGMSIARVSVVDGSGKEVFDELIRLDDGVDLIDYNTRFSGIHADTYTTGAVRTLDEVRGALDKLINSETIIIGHALENDLKALRMLHGAVVDTVALFPHSSGPPYRRALRDLTKEHLGRAIQLGGASGSAGHSSVEDSVATLDLVKFYVLKHGSIKPLPITGMNGGGRRQKVTGETPAKAASDNSKAAVPAPSEAETNTAGTSVKREAPVS